MLFQNRYYTIYEKPYALKPSDPAAHPKKRLLLLPSGPDRVHALKSHGTQPSLYTRLDDYTMPPVKKQQLSRGRRKKVRYFASKDIAFCIKVRIVLAKMINHIILADIQIHIGHLIPAGVEGDILQ